MHPPRCWIRHWMHPPYKASMHARRSHDSSQCIDSDMKLFINLVHVCFNFLVLAVIIYRNNSILIRFPFFFFLVQHVYCVTIMQRIYKGYTVTEEFYACYISESNQLAYSAQKKRIIARICRQRGWIDNTAFVLQQYGSLNTLHLGPNLIQRRILAKIIQAQLPTRSCKSLVPQVSRNLFRSSGGLVD